jgi:hypothetical protein
MPIAQCAIEIMTFIGALAFDWQHLAHTEVPFSFQRNLDTNLFKQ